LGKTEDRQTKGNLRGLGRHAARQAGRQAGRERGRQKRPPHRKQGGEKLNESGKGWLFPSLSWSHYCMASFYPFLEVLDENELSSRPLIEILFLVFSLPSICLLCQHRLHPIFFSSVVVERCGTTLTLSFPSPRLSSGMHAHLLIDIGPEGWVVLLGSRFKQEAWQKHSKHDCLPSLFPLQCSPSFFLFFLLLLSSFAQTLTRTDQSTQTKN